MLTRALAAVSVLLFAMLHLPPEAQACSCAEKYETVPREGETVPRNAWLWLSVEAAKWAVAAALRPSEPDRARQVAFTQPTLRELVTLMSLRGPDGREVRYGLTEIRDSWGGTIYFIVKPKVDLLPGPHEFGPSPQATDAPPQRLAENTVHFTASVEAATLPTLPQVSIKKAVSYSKREMCDSYARYIPFEVEHDGRFVLLDVDEQAQGNEYPYLVVDLFESEPIILGSLECLSNWDFPSDAPAAVRFGVLNIAGQFSGWTAPKLVVPPPDPASRFVAQSRLARQPHAKSSCVCGLARAESDGSGAIWAALVVCAALGRRARRARRRSC